MEVGWLPFGKQKNFVFTRSSTYFPEYPILNSCCFELFVRKLIPHYHKSPAWLLHQSDQFYALHLKEKTCYPSQQSMTDIIYYPCKTEVHKTKSYNNSFNTQHLLLLVLRYQWQQGHQTHEEAQILTKNHMM